MNITNLPVMDLLQQKMKYTAERQDYISQNIANADTPEYKRKDLKKPDFSKMVSSYNKGLELSTTNSMHIKSPAESTNFVPYETNDTVELDQEAIAMMQNRIDYNSATTTYKKILTILKDVANSNK